MEIEATISLLITYWEKQGVKITPNTVDQIASIQRSNQILIPDDFKLLYSRVNGMKNFYPNEIDDEGFLFYPIEAVVSVDREFETSGLINKESIFIFSEYMHRSWWYAFKIVDDKNYQIGIIPNKNTFVPITTRLTEFIELYLEDDPRLYNY